jgi:hypothetical protein
MDRKIPIFIFAAFVSNPIFAVVPIDSGVGGECACTCVAEDDFSSGSCVGDCDCVVDCDGTDCVADCLCIALEEDEDIIEQDDELIFEDIDEDRIDVDDTGLMGTTEGTFADYEEVFVLDGETPITNEVTITPGWCD